MAEVLPPISPTATLDQILTLIPENTPLNQVQKILTPLQFAGYMERILARAKDAVANSAAASASASRQASRLASEVPTDTEDGGISKLLGSGFAYGSSSGTPTSPITVSESDTPTPPVASGAYLMPIKDWDYKSNRLISKKAENRGYASDGYDFFVRHLKELSKNYSENTGLGPFSYIDIDNNIKGADPDGSKYAQLYKNEQDRLRQIYSVTADDLKQLPTEAPPFLYPQNKLVTYSVPMWEHAEPPPREQTVRIRNPPKGLEDKEGLLYKAIIDDKLDFKKIHEAQTYAGAQKVAQNMGPGYKVVQDDPDRDGVMDIFIKDPEGRNVVINGWTTKPSDFPYRSWYMREVPPAMRKYISYNTWLDEKRGLEWESPVLGKYKNPRPEGWSHLVDRGYANKTKKNDKKKKGAESLFTEVCQFWNEQLSEEDMMKRKHVSQGAKLYWARYIQFPWVKKVLAEKGVPNDQAQFILAALWFGKRKALTAEGMGKHKNILNKILSERSFNEVCKNFALAVYERANSAEVAPIKAKVAELTVEALKNDKTEAKKDARNKYFVELGKNLKEGVNPRQGDISFWR